MDVAENHSKTNLILPFFFSEDFIQYPTKEEEKIEFGNYYFINSMYKTVRIQCIFDKNKSMNAYR